jgi:hypothetical protein
MVVNWAIDYEPKDGPVEDRIEHRPHGKVAVVAACKAQLPSGDLVC